MVNTWREKMGYIRALDKDCLEVFAGVFKSQQDVEDFLQITDGVPKGLMEKLYLEGEFIGRVEYKFFEKKSNLAEELLSDFPYGDKIIEVFKAKYVNKLKKKANTIIVIYDFHLGNHFSNHPLGVMKEKKCDEYHIFNINNVVPYK